MTKQDIVIIDYSVGNLRSVEKAFQYAGLPARIISTPAELHAADKIVLPGVGAMSKAHKELNDNGFISALSENILMKQKPFLGICLGFQLLFDTSEEDGGSKGLGIIPGRVVRFQKPEKIPHIGWNNLNIKKKLPLFKKVPSNPYVYFVHSYHAMPDDEEVVASYTLYGEKFVSAICSDNIMGTQFHPEKSQKWGLQIIENFGAL